MKAPVLLIRTNSRPHLVFRQTRKDYITAKYTEKRFARQLCADDASRLQVLYEAVRNRDILSLIQVYAEGVDLMEASPQPNEHVRQICSVREVSEPAVWRTNLPKITEFICETNSV